MTHIKAFPKLFNCKYSNIKWELTIDQFNHFLEINDSFLSINDESFIKL